MSNEKQYLSVNKEHLSRVYQNVGSLSDKLDMDVFQNFVDVQNNDDPEIKKQVFNQVLLEIKKIKENGASKQELADIYYLLGYKVKQYSGTVSFQVYFYYEAFALYDDVKDFNGIVSCGGSLFVLLMSKKHLSEKDVDQAFKIVNVCLSEIEAKEGRGDHYCYFIMCCNIFNSLCQKECQKYLVDFMIDYSPQDTEIARYIYDELAQAIRVMYKSHISVSDPEHKQWVDNYVKYQSLSISNRRKIGTTESDYGKLWLGEFYSIEYSNTGNEEFYEKSKQLLTSINSKYRDHATGHLNDLESIKQRRQ